MGTIRWRRIRHPWSASLGLAAVCLLGGMPAAPGAGSSKGAAARENRSPEEPANTGNARDADALNDQVFALWGQGRYAEALPLAERALAIRLRVLGLNNAATAQSYFNVAAQHIGLGNYAKALPLYEKAVAIDQKVFGLKHPQTALDLSNLGDAYVKMGNLAKAEPLFKQALEIDEKALPANHHDIGLILESLAGLYQDEGLLAKARPLFKRSLAISEKANGPEDRETATSLINLAGCLQRAGDYAQAEPLYQRALSIDEKVLGPVHPELVIDLNNLALLDREIGRFDDALPLLTRALAIREKSSGPMHPETAKALMALGELHKEMGNHAAAVPLLKRALDIAKKSLGINHPETALILNELAGDYCIMRQFDDAAMLFDKALEICEKTLGPNHPQTGVEWHNLGWLSMLRGNDQKAEEDFLRGLKIMEKTYGPDNYTVTAEAVKSLAKLDTRLGKTEEAQALSRRAERADLAELRNVLSFTSEQERLAFRTTTRPFDIPANLGDARLICDTVLHFKGVVLDSLLEDHLLAQASKDPELRALIGEIRAAKQDLTQVSLQMSKSLTPEESAQREALHTQRLHTVEGLEGNLARKVAGLGRARQALSVTTAQVQAALAPGQVLVEFITFGQDRKTEAPESFLGAVVLPRQGAPHWVVLGPVKEFARTVKIYEKCVRQQTDEVAVPSTLRAIYDQIWAPIEKVLPPETSTVILSPDADLDFISLATLTDPQDQFLAEKYSLRYVSSGRDLLRAGERVSQRSVVAFGNPDFRGSLPKVAARAGAEPSASRSSAKRDASQLTLAPLPGTEAECRALQAALAGTGGEARIFLGSEATESQLRKVKAPYILHLATHGFFLAAPDEPGEEAALLPDFLAEALGRRKPATLSNPMYRSGLALAGAQRTLDAWRKGEVPPVENDGVVTAEEIGGLSLQGTWLVTLSACDTGSGEVRAGEGVLGLRRGFLQAGVQNLLMTLWPISDETTVDIMNDFYRRALASDNAPQALAETQRDWLVKLRKERGLGQAVSLAGSFIMTTQGGQK